MMVDMLLNLGLSIVIVTIGMAINQHGCPFSAHRLWCLCTACATGRLAEEAARTQWSGAAAGVRGLAVHKANSSGYFWVTTNEQ